MALDGNTPKQVRDAYKINLTDSALVEKLTAIQAQFTDLTARQANDIFVTAYGNHTPQYNDATRAFNKDRAAFEQAKNTFETHMATPVAQASNALAKLSVDVGMVKARQALSDLQKALITQDRAVVNNPTATPAVDRQTDLRTIENRRDLDGQGKQTLFDELAPSLRTLDPQALQTLNPQEKLGLMTAALAIDDDPEPAAGARIPRKTPSEVVTDFAQQLDAELDAEQKTRGRLVRGLKATAGKYNQVLEALQDAIVTRDPNATLPGQPLQNIADLISAHRETTKKIADHKQVSLEAAAKWAAELNRLDQSAEALGVDRHRKTSDQVRQEVKAAAKNPAKVSKAQKAEKKNHSSRWYTVEVTLDKNGTKTYKSKSPEKLAAALERDGHKIARITSQPGQPPISVEKARKFVRECNKRNIAVDPSTIPTTNKLSTKNQTKFETEMARNQALFDQNNYQKTQATNLPSWIENSLSQPAQGNDAIIRSETTDLADQMAREAASGEMDNPFPGGLPGMGPG